MNSAELVKEISRPPTCSGTIGSMRNWWIGSYKSVSSPSSDAAIEVVAARPSRLDHARRPQHAQHAGGEAEEHEHDQPPGGCAEQAINPPAERDPDDHAGNEIRAETQRHCHPRTIRRAGARHIVRAAGPAFTEPPVEVSELS